MGPVIAYLKSFFWSQLFDTPPYPTTSFAGQTVIITGASSGLGLEAACHFARLHADHIILAVRDEAKGAAAAAYVREHTATDPACKSSVWQLDLSSFFSVKRFVQRVKSNLSRLDVVVQNAGLSADTFELTDDGHELLLQVHVLAPALLALHLLPFMQSSSERTKMKGRMTFCGSSIFTLSKLMELEENDKIDLIATLDNPGKANMSDRYMTTKLLLLYLTQALSVAFTLFEKTNPLINFTTPGFARSNIVRKEFGLIGRTVKEVVTFCLARSTEVGSRVLVDATTCDNALFMTHGNWFRDGKAAETSGKAGPLVHTQAGRDLAGAFLASLRKAMEAADPGIMKILDEYKAQGPREGSNMIVRKLNMSWAEVE